MSASDQLQALSSETRSTAQDIPARTTDEVPTLSPVEMNSLQADGTIGSTLNQQETRRISNSEFPHQPMRTDTTTALQHASDPSAPQPPLPAIPQKVLTPQPTAIGAAQDAPAPAPAPKDIPQGPVLMLNLLLISGQRHPFNLDAAYLAKRNVQTQGNDPFNLSVYKVKELILREWRGDWEAKPSSPSAIRLIYLGKVLDDKTPFKDLKFQPTHANVVHMSIKPQDFMEDEDAKGAKATRTHSHDGTEGRSPGCRCIVM